jgi:hypothetical protein
MESHWEDDRRVEGEIGKFMDKFFYSKLADRCGIKAERVYERELQLSGVDLYLTNSHGAKCAMDEKAASHYINSKLGTFAFEVLSRDSNIGWLVNGELKTDVYSIMWVEADDKKYPVVDSGATNYYHSLNMNDIRKVECLWIEKKKVLGYLKEKGYDSENLYKRALFIKEKGWTGKVDTYPTRSNDFWFYSTSNLAERPINVQIKKEVLLELAHSRYCVTREGF